jgi:hypothetical protein
MQENIYTYSEDFFMTAFFTLRAHGISTMVLVAGGGVIPAGCTVPATAMVTTLVEVVYGSVPAVSAASSAGTSFPSESGLGHLLAFGVGRRSRRTAKKSVSMQQF